MPNFDKQFLKDKIIKMIRNQEFDESVLKSLTMQELIQEISVYHQELMYQNEELLNRSLELEQAKALYQKLFEDSPVGYLVIDSNYVIKSANKTFSSYIGTVPNRLIGKTLTSMIHPDSQDAFYFCMQQLMKQGAAEVSVLKLTAGGSGEENPRVAHLTCNQSIENAQTLIRCAFTDITKEFNQGKEIEMYQEVSVDMIDILDLKGNFLKVNSAFEDVLGYRKEEMEGHSIKEFLHPDDLNPTLEAYQDLLKRNRIDNYVNRYRCKDGSYRSIEWRAVVNNSLIYTSGRDITQRLADEEALKLSEEKYRMITENISDVIVVYNVTQEKMTYVSPSIQSLLGFSSDELFSRSLTSLFHAEDQPVFWEKASSMLEQYQNHPEQPLEYSVEARAASKEGPYLWVEIVSKVGRNIIGEVEILSLCRNIERRKKAEQELAHLINHDKLTELFNRHYFEKKVMEEISRSDRYKEPVSMVLFDLDHFKSINDNWGHLVGDAVLKQTARLAGLNLRNTDVLARLGGEEFVVLLPHTDEKAALAAAEKIRVAIEASIHPIAGKVTASFGVAERLPLEAFVGWYKRLDDALYDAKQTGRNRTVVATGFSAYKSLTFEWSSDWDSGDPDIDDQHKELIESIKIQFRRSLEIGKDADPADLDQLVGSLLQHFAFEEALLTKLGYPEQDYHAKVHSALTKTLRQKITFYQEHGMPVTDLLVFIMEEVIIGHMLKDDMAFFPYTRKTEGSPPQEERETGS